MAPSLAPGGAHPIAQGNPRGTRCYIIGVSPNGCYAEARWHGCYALSGLRGPWGDFGPQGFAPGLSGAP